MDSYLRYSYDHKQLREEVVKISRSKLKTKGLSECLIH